MTGTAVMVIGTFYLSLEFPCHDVPFDLPTAGSLFACTLIIAVWELYGITRKR